jgi:predicted Co/Zn/Cd cation transporter (cation efflux family)
MKKTADEQHVLKVSIWVTLGVSASGVAFGLLSGSLSIVFDGVFSAIDAAMSVLALFVARLLVRPGSRRFQFGYWHFEPIAVAFNGGIMMLLCFYAFLNACDSLMAGGREIAFGWGMLYAFVISTVCLAMFFYEQRANRRLDSDFLRIDAQGWLMAGTISTALLIAFTGARLIAGTRFDHYTRYVDPAVLMVLTLGLIGVPIRTVRKALREVFLVTSSELDLAVRKVMDEVVARHGFKSFSSYAAKVGRAHFIEIHLLAPPDYAVRDIATLDRIRDEIGNALGDAGPQRWLTVAFTADSVWT